MKLNIQKFASGESQWFEDLPLQMKLTWESTPGDSTQNYSLVTAKIWGARNSSSTKGKSWNGYVNIGGNSHYFSEIYTGQSTTIGTAWVLINYFTDTILHNNDGTKTITISGGLGGPSGTSLSSKYAEGSTQATLDTIPRGSTFNTTAWNRDTQRLLTSTLSIPATQHVANVYHKLEARFMSSGTETTICTRTGVTIDNGYISFSFTNNELNTIYNLMPKETTHYIRMYLYTYTDSSYQNQLGDVSIIWWTGLIPTSVIPSVTFASYTEGGDVPSSWGVWVKNKSKVNVTLSGTGIYGSTISSYSLNGDGVTYYTNPTLTNYLSSSGNITFTGTTTDSRNRQGSATLTLSVEDYYNPTIATAQVQRCDVNGNIDRNGEYVYISYDGSISPCANKNTPYAEYKIGYKTTTSDTYTYITLATNTNNYSATGMLFTDGIFTPDSVGTKLQFSSDYTYDIQFYVKDYFTINDDNVQILDTGFDLMNFNPSGKSMAIGKVSEASSSDELLEIALDTEISGDVDINNNGTMIISKNGNNILRNNSYGTSILSSASNGQSIVFRPNGDSDQTNQATLNNYGGLQISGDFEANAITKAHYIELGGSGLTTPYIDFHYNNSGSDYTSRIIETSSGNLEMQNNLRVNGNITKNGNPLYGEIVLFSGDSNNNITLSDSAANYTYLEIWFRPNDSTDWQGYEKIYSPNGKTFDLNYAVLFAGTQVYIKNSAFSINGTSITQSYGIEYYFSNNSSVRFSQTSNIYITRIVGLK